jgi:hypothetical protein
MQRNGVSIDQAIALVASLSTALLAALTVWLAWDTHHLAQLTAEQAGLEARVGLVRECDVDTRDDVQARDALIDLQPNTKDGYEGSDQVSRPDMFAYLKASADDYLRCTLSNFGRRPLLDVQTVFDADFPEGRRVEIVSTRFHVIAPNESKNMWFANNSGKKITIHSPQRVRYRTFDNPNQAIVEEAKPTLKDQWVLRPGHLEEILDQGETKDF